MQTSKMRIDGLGFHACLPMLNQGIFVFQPIASAAGLREFSPCLLNYQT